jgi:glycosyltransferase involved in cell wall biosynthesis
VKADFCGIKSNQLLPDELNVSEIFILPSLYEGNPKALIEAMACGKPVIGTKVTGIKELILHGETGLLCDPDIDSIRETIKNLLIDQKTQEMDLLSKTSPRLGHTSVPEDKRGP